jgi:hypothetical protein
MSESSSKKRALKKRGEMKKSQLTDQAYRDQAYQNVPLGSDEEGATPCAGAKDASDDSIKKATSHAIVDRGTQAVRHTQKKAYSKPTLIMYGTDRELARRHEPKI